MRFGASYAPKVASATTASVLPPERLLQPTSPLPPLRSRLSRSRSSPNRTGAPASWRLHSPGGRGRRQPSPGGARRPTGGADPRSWPPRELRLSPPLGLLASLESHEDGCYMRVLDSTWIHEWLAMMVART